MAEQARKLRLCSYDRAEVPADAYIVTDSGGEMYFCNARCLSIWAVDFATKPNRPPEQKSLVLHVKTPTGVHRQLPNADELANWALATLSEEVDEAESAPSTQAGDYTSPAPSEGSSAASTFERRFMLVAWISAIRCL